MSTSSSLDMYRYSLLSRSCSMMYFSLAVTKMWAELPSGKVPTALVFRLISRLIRSAPLLVRIRRRCSGGKPVKASVLSKPSHHGTWARLARPRQPRRRASSRSGVDVHLKKARREWLALIYFSPTDHVNSSLTMPNPNHAHPNKALIEKSPLLHLHKSTA